MPAKTVAVCNECHKKIHKDAILIVPPNYEILLGVSSISYYHRKCAEKRGIDLSDLDSHAR